MFRNGRPRGRSGRHMESSSATLIAALVSRCIQRSLNAATVGASAAHPDAIGDLSTDPLSDEECDEDDERHRTSHPSLHGPFLRNAARGGACAAAWHGVVPDAAHRAALEVDAHSIVGHTFWVGASDSPRCSLERFALGVLRFHAASTPGVHGAEWWVQVRRSNGTPTIPLHWDSDEEHKAASGEHVPPYLATVTYLGGAGAPTLVLPVAADAHGRALRAGSSAFVSQPVAGKHLSFDGRLLHGALQELGSPSSEQFVRTSILVNLWIGHQPDAHRLPAALAAKLSNMDVASFADAQLVKAQERHCGVSTIAADLPDAAAAAGWRTLRVGFTPLRRMCEVQPHWRQLAKLVGFPYCHPDVRVRGLLWERAGIHPPSLVRVRDLRLQLPFEEDVCTGYAAADDDAEEEQELDAAGAALLKRAVDELSTSGEWRAARELHRLIPALAKRLPDARIGDARNGYAAHGGSGDSIEGANCSDRPQIGGEAALLYLVSSGLTACALCLIYGRIWTELGALAVNADDADGYTALHYAANQGMTDLVAPLLEVGACVDASTRDVSSLAEPGGRTPLHFAAAAGHRQIVRELLAAGADPSCRDWQGATPSQLGYRRGHSALAAEIERFRRVGSDSVKRGDTEMPTDIELRGFELAEAMSMRERTRQRLSVEGRLMDPFTLKGLLSVAECTGLIAAAECEARRRGWQSTRHRHYPTVDLPLHDIPHSHYARVRSRLDEVVLTTMRSRYAPCRGLRIREAFIVRYEAPEAGDGGAGGEVAQGGTAKEWPKQPGLALHRDGTLLNCIILLSSPSEFEGGGTVFAPPLDSTYRSGRGDCLCSCGQYLHGAEPVSRGVRYVLVAFIDELQVPPEDDDED